MFPRIYLSPHLLPDSPPEHARLEHDAPILLLLPALQVHVHRPLPLSTDRGQADETGPQSQGRHPQAAFLSSCLPDLPLGWRWSLWDLPLGWRCCLWDLPLGWRCCLWDLPVPPEWSFGRGGIWRPRGAVVTCSYAGKYRRGGLDYQELSLQGFTQLFDYLITLFMQGDAQAYCGLHVVLSKP